jgi:hypothetical protein
MADRPDIDALLIGALYGELTPAEETRLTAHLETHPGDRIVLADLTRAREVVRESRFLELQADPPQAMSALLLQEAARRAPKVPEKEKQGWFARFVRAFAAHPAMAAAAMLVIVVGVATLVTRRSGDLFVNSTAPAAESSAQPPPAPSDLGIVGAGAAVAGDSKPSEPTEQYGVDLAGQQSDKNLVKKERAPATRGRTSRQQAPAAKGDFAKPSVVTAAPAPAAPGRLAAPISTVDDADADAAAERRTADPALVALHDRVVAEASEDCRAAANTAVALWNRSPAYYDQSVASDRRVARCKQYIEPAISQQVAERKRSKDAESKKRPLEPKAKTTSKPAATDSK